MYSKCQRTDKGVLQLFRDCKICLAVWLATTVW